MNTHTENSVPKPTAFGWFRVFVWVQATVLVVAAVLKGGLVLTDSFADLRTGYPITILCLAIVFELVAAAWLIFCRDATIKWLILASAFSLFLFVSLIRYSMGIEGCGCLGSVELPRWLLPLNSVFVLAALAVFARHPRSRTLFRFRKTTQILRKKLSNPKEL